MSGLVGTCINQLCKSNFHKWLKSRFSVPFPGFGLKLKRDHFETLKGFIYVEDSRSCLLLKQNYNDAVFSKLNT